MASVTWPTCAETGRGTRIVVMDFKKLTDQAKTKAREIGDKTKRAAQAAKDEASKDKNGGSGNGPVTPA